MTKADINKIKKLAQDLMDTLIEEQQVMANLRDRASAQAQMKMAIIDQLLVGMPDEFTNEDIEARADLVFQYIQQQRQYATMH